MKKRFYLSLAGVLFFSFLVFSQSGTLDNTFGNAGKLIQNIGFPGFEMVQTAIQNDGKIVVAGYAEYTGTSVDFVLIRFNTNGSLDNTFDGDGVVTTDIQTGSYDEINAMSLVSGGKILVAGSGGGNVLVRYNSNGSLDNTFDGDGIKSITNPGDFIVKDMLIQTDGKIVLAGDGNTSSNFILLRFSSEGVPDNTFDGDGIAVLNFDTNMYYASAVAVQGDGKLVVTGTQLDLVTYDYYTVTARVTASGVLDNTFNTTGWTVTNLGPEIDFVTDIMVQSLGGIVVSGYGLDDGAAFKYTYLLRYTTAGVLDNSFDGDGILNINSFTAGFFSLGQLTPVTGNKILMTGVKRNPSGIYSFALLRLSTDGSFDNTFGTGGIIATAAPANSQLGIRLAIQTDGMFITGGYISNGINFQPCLLRLQTNGIPDPGFDGDGIALFTMGNAPGADEGRTMVISSDDKILAAGYYSKGLDRGGFLYRFTAAGIADNTFGPAADGKVYLPASFSSDISSVTLQGDGKILITGRYYDIIDGYDVLVCRYNNNGTPDNTFGTNGRIILPVGSSTLDNGLSIGVQTDGKIIVLVLETKSTGSQLYLYRFTSNGVVDNTFGTAGRVTVDMMYNSNDYCGTGQLLKVQQNDKILVTGAVNAGSFDNIAVRRYNSDGSIDNTFNSGVIVSTDIAGGDDAGRAVVLQSDGKILVASESVTSGFGYKIALVRYNGNGTLDNTFSGDGKVVVTEGINFNQYPTSIVVQSDTKILVAGTGFDASFNSKMLVARLTAGGVLDNTFGTSGIAEIPFTADGDDIAYAMGIQSDGKVVLCGKISSSRQENLALFRLNNTISTAVTNRNQPLAQIIVAPNPLQHELILRAANLPDGKYYIRVTTADGRLIEAESFAVRGGVLQLNLPANAWPAGVLLITVSGNTYQSTYKIMKQ